MSEILELANINLNIFTQEKDPEDIEFRRIDISDPKLMQNSPNRRRRSPIMVEFADPRVKSVDIAQALEAGMNIIKLRMAHTSHAEKIRMLSKLDKAASRAAAKTGVPSCPVATCVALKTWVKKCGIFKDVADVVEKVSIAENAEVILTSDQSLIEKCTPSMIYVDYGHLGTVPIGMEITFGSGEVIMSCTKIVNDKTIKCVVTKGGQINSLMQVFFRNLKNTTPYLCQIDVDILKFCARYHVDILIIYYAQEGAMIRKIRDTFSKSQFTPLIFSCICNQEGIDNLDNIIKASDGIILCRDFLTYELDVSQLHRQALVQKHIAGKCQMAGRPLFITAVFEGVVAQGDVDDKEISDVTNALMDGVSGFIIRYCQDINNTLIALRWLNDICCQVEPLTFDKRNFWRLMTEPVVPVNAAEAAALSCMMTANLSKARVVIICTVTGRTVRELLWLRPSCIVIAVCQRPTSARLLFTCRNVVPLVYKGETNKAWHMVEDARVKFAAEYAIARHWLVYGDIYVALQRSFESHLFCDMVRVWTVTTRKKHRVECHYSDEDEKKIEEPAVVPEPETPKRKRKKKKEEQPPENNEEENLEIR